MIEYGLVNIDSKHTSHNKESMKSKYEKIISFLQAANQSHECNGTHKSINSMIRSNKRPSESEKMMVGGFLHTDWHEKDEADKQKFCDSFREYPLLSQPHEIRFTSLPDKLEDLIKFIPIKRKMKSFDDRLDFQKSLKMTIMVNGTILAKMTIWSKMTILAKITK